MAAPNPSVAIFVHINGPGRVSPLFLSVFSALHVHQIYPSEVCAREDIVQLRLNAFLNFPGS